MQTDAVHSEGETEHMIDEDEIGDTSTLPLTNGIGDVNSVMANMTELEEINNVQIENGSGSPEKDMQMKGYLRDLQSSLDLNNWEVDMIINMAKKIEVIC